MNDESEKWKVIGLVWIMTIFLSAILFAFFRLFLYIMSGN